MSTPTDEPALLVEREGGVLALVLNRPTRRNAVTNGIVATLVHELQEAATDDTTRVIVLRGAGDHFCSGFDLGGPARSGARPRAGHLQRGFPFGAHRVIELLHAVQVPVVAEVRGYAAGFGNALALSADFVVASTTARFWVPFVTRGFTPDSGNSYILPRLIGLARAKEMFLRGRQVDGETAAAWGLVSACVPDDQLSATVADLVTELAGAATVALGLAKSLLHANLDADLPAALQNDGIYEELAVRSDDFKEGLRAFAEKRPPNFTGR